MRRENISGLKCHHWTAIKPTGNLLYGGKVATAWICRCACGNERVLPTEHFKKGAFYSCGCLKPQPHRPQKEDRGCKVKGCLQPYGAKGYCYPHYYQWRRYGDPLIRLRSRKGSGSTNPHGYRLLKGKLEHRSVMSAFLGRDLTRDESVHHINGDRSDNRIENLELWSRYQPSGQRVQDKIEYAKDLLTKYGILYPTTPQTRVTVTKVQLFNKVEPEVVFKSQTDGLCRVLSCARETHARGLCRKHYSWLLSKGLLGRSRPSCKIVGCTSLHQAKGMCSYHYNQSRRSGIRPRQKRLVGTGSLHGDGYWLINVRGKQILEHRLVMERILGRPLLRHESVHHKNGDRLDNRPENLELWSKSQPAGQRVIDKLSWARSFLFEYEV